MKISIQRVRSTSGMTTEKGNEKTHRSYGTGFIYHHHKLRIHSNLGNITRISCFKAVGSKGTTANTNRRGAVDRETQA